MINKKKFFRMFLILLCINYASSLILKINSFSNFKCDSATGLLNFNLEAKEVTNDLKLQPFFLFLQQTGGELGYLSLCKLEDEEKLKSIAEGSNDVEDISFTCSIESYFDEFKSTEVDIIDVSDLKGDTIEFQNVGENKLTLDLTLCQMDIDEYNLALIKKTISFHQVSHYQTFKDEKKIKFIYSVFQTLPENYVTPVRIAFGPVSLSEDIGNLPIGDMEGIEDMEGLGDFEGMEGIEGG